MAVEVLLSLNMAQDDTPEQKKAQSKDVTFLATGNTMQKSILRNVLRRLLMTRYISVNIGNPKKYALQKNPEEITLMHLIQLFHGDICIGESYDHYQVRGYESIPTQSYVLFRRYERQLYEELRDNIAKMPITTFRQSPEALNAPLTKITTPEAMLLVGNG